VVFIPFTLSLLSLFTLFLKRDRAKLEALGVSYLFGVLFSIGALLSIIFTVTTQDLAFGWATTLDINSTSLSTFLNKLAFWKSFCSSCTISEHLAQISEFRRLGGAVTKEQIDNAKELGSWWKFIALSILFYGVVFRGVLYLITKYFIKDKSDIKIVAQDNEDSVVEFDNNYSNKIAKEELHANNYRVVGYNTNIPSDLKSIDDAADIVVVVKSWEPPILDFFDYLEELKEDSKGEIIIYFKGLNSKPKDEDIDIWLRKLNELKLNYKVAL